MTVNYWLGLNKLAEERWAPNDGTETGRSGTVRRVGAETGATPEANGWCVYNWSGAETLAYATDGHRGQVLRVASTGTAPFPAQGLIGDHGTLSLNVLGGGLGSPWGDNQRRHLGLWFRNASTAGDKRVQLIVFVRATNGTAYQLSFVTGTGTDGYAGSCLTDYIGTGYNDGDWHYLEFDLYERMKTLSGNALTLNYADGIMIRCKDAYVDDVVLSGGYLNKTYAVNPGASIAAYSGQQAGPLASGAGSKTYFQYNDLGTVLAQTDAAGDVSGLWQPDYYGNYRYKYSTSPDRPDIGPTSKFYDSHAGLWYFNARWYDQERGRWVSKDPIFQLNLYAFCRNNVTNMIDPNGKREWPGFTGGSCCNSSDSPVAVLQGGKYRFLCPGECLDGDCDGMWCHDKFYPAGWSDELDCRDGKTGCVEDDPGSADDPVNPGNPTDKGAPDNDQPQIPESVIWACHYK